MKETLQTAKAPTRSGNEMRMANLVVHATSCLVVLLHSMQCIKIGLVLQMVLRKLNHVTSARAWLVGYIVAAWGQLRIQNPPVELLSAHPVLLPGVGLCCWRYKYESIECNTFELENTL